MTDVVHQTAGQVHPAAVDRPGGQPEGVVAHVAQVVRREPADAVELGRTVLDQVWPRDVEPVRVLYPILRFDAREPGQRIADFPERTAGGLVVQGAEVALVEEAAQPEGADAPVDAVRLIQIEGGAAEVVEQVAEAEPENDDTSKYSWWSLSRSLKTKTAPCADPTPGATTASPAAKSSENLRSYGAALARAYCGLASSGHVHSGARRSAASATRRAVSCGTGCAT